MPTNAERRELLLNLIPHGLPVTKKWLMTKSRELDRHAIDNLVKSRQLEVLAPGVYKLPATRVSWDGLVCFLQTIVGHNLFVGGLTALELQGYAHYLPLGRERTIHLYGSEPLPYWINAVLPDVKFSRHPSLRTIEETGLTEQRPETSPEAVAYRLSSVERAYLEVLMDVPEGISFEHADQLLQGMTTLSPRKLEPLLLACRDIKVRRLFYWLAERHKHPWFDRLPDPMNLDDLGLGSGNRMLIKGGKLATKYMITVPEEMWISTTNTIDK